MNKLYVLVVLVLLSSPSVLLAQADSDAKVTNSGFTSIWTLPGFTEHEPLLVPGEKSSEEVFTRDVSTLKFTNFFTYGLSQAVEYGIPVETLVLTMMIPVLATLVTISRNLIGLPSLDTLVVISFSIALLASNIVIGVLLLAVILIASIVARMVFRKVRIMQQPKITLSMLFVSIAVLFALFAFAAWGIVPVSSISVVPVLLLIIMSERIVRLQFDSHPGHAWNTVFTTLILGIGGYYLLLWESARIFLINYPEMILLLIPLNIYIGRFFGLRLMERFRFRDLLKSR
ncbi:MAG: 7TM domain-containing protein [Patescibacteria group bacterium]